VDLATGIEVHRDGPTIFRDFWSLEIPGLGGIDQPELKLVLLVYVYGGL
jgi:hypothetical protein